MNLTPAEKYEVALILSEVSAKRARATARMFLTERMTTQQLIENLSAAREVEILAERVQES